MREETSEFKRLVQELRDGKPGADIEFEQLLLKNRPSPQTATNAALRSLFSSLHISEDDFESYEAAVAALYARRRQKQIDKYRYEHALKRRPADAKVVEIQEGGIPDGGAATPEQEALDRESVELLDCFIRALHEQHQLLLRQIYWEGQTITQIAIGQQINESTVRGRRDRALRELKGILLLHGKELTRDD